MSGIGLIGTSSTGKTTLANEIAKMTGIPFIPSPAREVFKTMSLSANESIPFDARLLAQTRILEVAEKTYSYMDSIFITDRTPMDFAAHMIAEALSANLTNYQSNEVMDYVKECYRVTNLYFSSVILLQPSISVVREVGRPTNRAYLEHINLIMIGLISDPDNKLYCAKHFMKKSVVDLKRRVESVIKIASIVEMKNMKQGELAGIH
jgi:predicted ATPase